jgi:hypothetical protein
MNKISMLTIMEPTHPQWKEFYDRLAGPEGCNFKKGTWTCKGGHNKDFAARLLKDYDVDIRSTLEYFDSMGWHCDCEVIFNCD